MNGAIGHWGHQAGIWTTPFSAADVDGTTARVASMLRGPGTVPYGFAMAVVWLATTGVAIAAPAASTWSLLPTLAHLRLARSLVVKTWRFSDEAQAAVLRPKASAAREFEIHADSCPRPLLARLPLAPAVRGAGKMNSTQEFPRRS